MTIRRQRLTSRRAASRQAEMDAIAARPLVEQRRVTSPPIQPEETREPELTELQRLALDLESELALAHGEITRLETMLARKQVTKAEVNYRPGSQAKRCGNCVMYHPGSLETQPRCDLVRGWIDPDAVCDRWERDATRV